MNKLLKKLKENDGYTDIEVIIFIVVFLIGIIFLFTYTYGKLKETQDKNPKQAIEHKAVKPKHKINHKVKVVE